MPFDKNFVNDPSQASEPSTQHDNAPSAPCDSTFSSTLTSANPQKNNEEPPLASFSSPPLQNDAPNRTAKNSSSNSQSSFQNSAGGSGPFFGNQPPFPPVPPFPPSSAFGWGMPPKPRSFWLGRMILNFFLSVAGMIVGVMALFFFGVMLLAVLSGVFLGDGTLNETQVTEKTLSGDEFRPHKIVILPIEGTIMGEEDGFVRQAIQQAYQDDKVAGIVLRVDSPGGTVSGSDYYYYLLSELKKERHLPIVVSMGSQAASGGYYVSMVGDKIFAERSTLTGSIGVIFPLYNAAKLCQTLGVRSNAITSGAMKGMGDFTQEMSEEERLIWQALVDESYDQFLDVVQEGRSCFTDDASDLDSLDDNQIAKNSVENDAKSEDSSLSDAESLVESNADSENSEALAEAADEALAEADSEALAEASSDLEANFDAESQLPQTSSGELTSRTTGRDRLRKIADGRIYTALQAKELGLIDEIGFLDDAVQEVMTQAGLDPTQVQVIRYQETENFSDFFKLRSQSDDFSAKFSAMMNHVGVPQLYYMSPRTFLVP